MFAQRLEFMMKLTGTTASALGRACSIDPSHISRMRKGSRPLPKNPAFLAPMSAYFARRIKADYQVKGLCELLERSELPKDESQLADLISLWLCMKEKSGQVEPILRSFTRQPVQAIQLEPVPISPEWQINRPYYYGPEGKRSAVARLFSQILKEDIPQTVLLFSDEEMGWLYEDMDFAALWSRECVKVLSAGNQVKIIHAVHRSIHEMLEGVSKWIPLYMTGRVEPYYYPKLRDNLFQRTMFIAPKTAAVVSTSVNNKTEGMLHTFCEEPEAVAALTLEYENFLELCRPLMRIYNAMRKAEFWEIYTAFLGADEEMLCMSSLPTLETMPEHVALSLQRRVPESDILNMRNKAADALSKFLTTNRYTELISDHWEDIEAVPVPFADLLGAAGLCYTPEEYSEHRAYLNALAKTSRSFKLRISQDISHNLTLYGKENKGILICKNDAPSVIFAFDEPNMTSAFYNYLYRSV